MVMLDVLGGSKGRAALSRDVANVVDCGGVEATLGGVNDEVRGIFGGEVQLSTGVRSTTQYGTGRNSAVPY